MVVSRLLLLWFSWSASWLSSALRYEVAVDTGRGFDVGFFGDDYVDFAAFKGCEQVADVELVGA